MFSGVSSLIRGTFEPHDLGLSKLGLSNLGLSNLGLSNLGPSNLTASDKGLAEPVSLGPKTGPEASRKKNQQGTRRRECQELAHSAPFVAKRDGIASRSRFGRNYGRGLDEPRP